MRKKYLWALSCALLVTTVSAATTRLERGTLTFDNIPEAPKELAESLEAYLNYRQAAPLGFSPKGQLLIHTRFADVPQLHVVESALGDRRQITFQHEPVTQAAFSPDPAKNALLYLKDVGGNENSQLFYQRIGELPKMISDGKSRNLSPLWSNAGKEIAFTSTVRDGKSPDVYTVDPESGALPKLAVTADGDGADLSVLDWSPDDRKLLLLKQVSVAEAYLYVVELATGQKKEVEPAPNVKVAIIGARFSRDGVGVYLISDKDSEFARLRYVNLFLTEKNSEKNVVSPKSNWDVEDLAISKDGHYLAYVGNEGGASKLNLLDLRTKQELIPPRMPTIGVIHGLYFDARGERLAFGFSAANQPEDAYVLDLGANKLEQWTKSEVGPLDVAKFVTPRLVSFPTFDRIDNKQRQEPAYVYEPAGSEPHPVLLLLHGGPESQFRPEFSAWYQYVVNELGYAVVVPNVRGSTGYGKAYTALDNGMLREDAVKDVGALIVWLSLQKEFDAKHIVVGGGSYGGYLMLATLVNYGERLKGGVDVAGFTDFVSFLTNTAPYRQALRRVEYGDERDPDMRAFLRRISPLTNADRINRPMLIVHGKNDPRVPVTEAEQLVNRLRLRNQEVWYLLAADEGHGYRKKQNVDVYLRVFAQFLTTLKEQP